MFPLSLFFFWTLCVLALGLQAVQAKSFKFTMSRVEQCSSVQLNFTRQDEQDGTPTSLTLLPFNATPIVIPIPESATNTTGVNVTFLPLPADAMFLASLDNAAGDNSAKVSDVTRVFPTDDASCLGTSTAVPSFTLPDSVTQCESFTVSYPPNTRAPTVRVVQPRGGSTTAEISNEFATEGRATYTMAEDHGEQVVLIAYQDNISQGWTSALLTVQGDSQSPSDCLKRNKGGDAQAVDGADLMPTGLANGTIVGLSVGGGLILLIAGIMFFYLVRQRQRRRRVASIAFDPALLEKRSYEPERHSGQPPSYSDGKAAGTPSDDRLSLPYSLRYSAGADATGNGLVHDPPYATEKYSPTVSGFRDSAGSWISMGTEALRRQLSQRTTAKERDRDSMNPYDIERMLDLAAAERNSIQSAMLLNRSNASPAIPDIQTPEPTANPRMSPTRRSPLDVQASLSISTYSINPLGSSQGYQVPSVRTMPDARASTVGGAGSPRVSYLAPSQFQVNIESPQSTTDDLPISSYRPPVPRSRFSDPSLMDGGSVGALPIPTYAMNAQPRDSNSSWGNLTTTGMAR